MADLINFYSNVHLINNNRLGFKVYYETIEDEAAILDSTNVTFEPKGYYGEYLEQSNRYINYYIYTCKDEDGNLIQNPVWPNDDYYHRFHITDVYPRTAMYFPEGWHLAGFTPRDVPISNVVYGLYDSFKTDPSGVEIINSGNYYKIEKATFESTLWKYTGGQTVEDLGFDTTEKRIDIVGTAVINEREEIICHTWGQDVDIANAWSIKARMTLPDNLDRRVTRIRFYIKLESDASFELVKEFDLLNGDLEEKTPFLIGNRYYEFNISNADREGTLLDQNIGFTFDPKQPNKYQLVTGFKDVAIDRNVKVAISSMDFLSVYYSTIAGGTTQPDLIYKANKIELPGLESINALASLGGFIAAITSSTMYAIRTVDLEDLVGFVVQETLEYGVKNRKDVAEVQGGAIVNTRNGIFLTNGYTSSLLSEGINNLITQYYNTSSIDYNKFTHELYWRPSLTDNIYRQRFEDKKWEELNVTDPKEDAKNPPLDSANDILIDLNGYKAYLSNNELWISKAPDYDIVPASLITANSDLGQPSILKLLNYFEIDFVGRFSVSVYYDNIFIYKFFTDLTASRITKKFYTPLDYRKQFNKLKLKFECTNINSILYNIETDFNIIRKNTVG